MPKIKSKKCAHCGKKIEGYGNNGYPEYEDEVCDRCNYAVIIPSRAALEIERRKHKRSK